MRPRILFVAPRVPWPLDGGWNQRMFHILTSLASIGDVDLLCYATPGHDPAAPGVGPAGDLCREVHLLPYPPEPWPEPARSYRDVLERFVLSPRPYMVSAFPGRPLAERVAAMAGKADLVWVERLFAAEWLTAGREKAIVDLDDIESVKERRRLALSPLSPWQLPLRFDNFRLRHLERSAPARFGGVVVCSESDRRFFPSRLRRQVLVVPNGVPATLLTRPRPVEEPASIVFVGRMRYAPNADAALWFIDHVLPRVAAVIPGVRLYVVGEYGDTALQRAHDGRRVVVTGGVDAVEPFVARAALSVAPIRVAGGTRIKILESLALGTPVVSTTIGAEGLGAADGRHLRLADTAERFAAEVVALLQDSAARESLRQNGRALVAGRFTWEVIGQQLAAALDARLPAGRSIPA